MPGIERITLFKVPEESIDSVLVEYDDLVNKAKKNGKPYIQSNIARRAYDDARTQGFSVVSVTKFASKEDHDFYDTECEAHKALKSAVKPKIEGVMTVYMDIA